MAKNTITLNIALDRRGFLHQRAASPAEIKIGKNGAAGRNGTIERKSEEETNIKAIVV
jgi:hypothetical protein